MSTQLERFRQQHPRLVYDRFDVNLVNDDVVVKLYFLLEPDIDFVTTLTYHRVGAARFQSLNQEVIRHWAFQVGLVELFSYWKAACPPEIVIKAGELKPEQLPFWQNLLQKGLSEFFFINKIDGWADGFVQWKVVGSPQTYPLDTTQHTLRTFVPIGGGKDSIVSLELLKAAQHPIATLVLNPKSKVEEVLKVGGVHENVVVTREIDPKIIQLNNAGYFNGHTPFSAMFSFVSTLAAYLYDYTYVAVSNEFSANEGNTTFLGQQINHQYSKTLEYETAFREYCQRYLSSTIQYFSFLRPLHEIQIAQVFSKFPEYFPAFLSCNRGQKTGKWCGACAKCLFVYIMLSPFVDVKELMQIWGEDLFAKPELKDILDELAGMVECKSFDCVGTREETLVALFLTLQRRSDSSLPVLLQYAKETILITENEHELQEKSSRLLQGFQSPHFLSEQFEQILKQALKG